MVAVVADETHTTARVDEYATRRRHHVSELNEQLNHVLNELEDSAKLVFKAPMSEDEIPDAMGRVRKVEVDLQQGRLGATRELDIGTHTGSTHKVVVGSKTERSYNLPRIIHDYMTADPELTLFTALMALVDADVLRIQVMWTNLKNELRRQQIGLHVQHTELRPDQIGDLEAPHVGEWQKATAPKIEGVTHE